MKNYVLLLLALLVHIGLLAQGTGRISGKVMDDKGQPMAGATVTIRESGNSTVTDNGGMFSFSNVKAGRVTLIVSFVGYADAVQTLQVNDNATTDATVTVSTRARAGDEVVVTASKRPEKITRAPASISVISAPGQKFHDPEADCALFDAIKKNLRKDIELLELDTEINSPQFAESCARTLLKNIRTRK